MWPLFLLSTPTDLYENAVLLMLAWGKNQVNRSTDKSSSSGQTCPLIEKHLELCVVRLNSKANFYQSSNEEKKSFAIFPFNDFKWWVKILFYFILYRRACLLIIETDIDRLLKQNMFQIIGLIRLFMCVHLSDLIFLRFDLIGCLLVRSFDEWICLLRCESNNTGKMRIYSKSTRNHCTH